jgi:U32 family peptidase
MLSREEVEILAPVGSFESLTAAIQGRANAVYFGVGKLNMRSKSTNNFSITSLEKIISICNDNHIRAYVTLNTIMYDDDIIVMQQLMQKCKDLGVHAIIASDIAVLEYAREIGIETHISTQQNISNLAAVTYFAKYADVLVLARELNLNQVKSIWGKIVDNKIIGPNGQLVKLEMFAHGALCMAISGKCYMSLHEYNQSANRGECLQICRRAYAVTDKETNAQLEIDNEYIMSPKDLCTIGFLDKLLNAGVRVLKIEGRARSAEYVKTVCECYNDAVNAVLQGSYNEALINSLTNKLSTVYNRGFWDGYYLGQRLGEWSSVYGSKATKKKVYIGKVMNYFSNLNVGEFLIETKSLKVGDDIMIVGPTTGVYENAIDEMRVDLRQVNTSKKGERFSMRVNVQIRRSDKLYKLIDSNSDE